jgi:alanyl-tRNA synthetase
MRTSDIDDVGDESHLTFFEMLGNFSFGGYWKEEAIRYSYDFITKELGLKIDYVSVFGGEGIPSTYSNQGETGDIIPADKESENIWNSIDPKIKIKKLGREDNFWGPTGQDGPCGPTTEIYVNGIEIWNIVFNQYFQNKDGTLRELANSGIDTGMGLERLAMACQKTANIFETDLFKPIIEMLPDNLDTRNKRIVADHLRASLFLMAEGIEPSNKDRGYILRKLIRRVIVICHINNCAGGLKTDSIHKLFELYKDFYPEMDLEKIMSVFHGENEKFRATLEKSLKEMARIENITAKEAFNLYESYGLPFEIIKEVGGQAAKDLKREDFEKEFKKHQELSRAGAEKKFGGHGLILDTGELKADNEEELKKAIRLHTATHILHTSLRKVLGNEVKQAGSDITAKRLRFDFTFHRKMTVEELEKVEDMANDVVENNLSVVKEEMNYEEAIKSGALAFFKLKYPDRVNVYTIGSELDEEPFSRELCGGPHVANTGEVGRIKIIKEEAVSSGIRRIRATVS